MRILFVSSGNSLAGISPIVLNQGESLVKLGHKVDYFTIKGKGVKGYFKSIFVLRRFLKKNKYDIIHAHYSLSAIIAALASKKKIIVSFMGSDVNSNVNFKRILQFFYLFFWKVCIVKTEEMKNKIGFKNIQVIPNGVDFDIFFPMNKKDVQKSLKWNPDIKHILFAANPARFEKNYELSNNACLHISDIKYELHVVENVAHNKMTTLFNAADVIILSSLWEGSPNVIKEAMACNRPIVSTNVGDVEWLFGKEEGHFIADPNPLNFGNKIIDALKYEVTNAQTNGRNRLCQLKLDSESVAQKLLNIYLNQSCDHDHN